MKLKCLILFLLTIPCYIYSMEAAEKDTGKPQAWSWSFQKYATNAPTLLGGEEHDTFLIHRYADGTLLPTAAERPVDVSNVMQRALQVAGSKDLTIKENQENLAAVLKIATTVTKEYPDITVTRLVAREPLDRTKVIYQEFIKGAVALHAREKAQQVRIEAQHALRLEERTKALSEARAKQEAELELEKAEFLRRLEERKAALAKAEAERIEGLKTQQAQQLAKVTSMRKTNDERARLEAQKLAAMMRTLCAVTEEDAAEFATAKFASEEAFRPTLSPVPSEEEEA